MRTYSQRALELKLCVEAGVVDPANVVRWADETLAAEDGYDDDLANVSITKDLSPATVSRLLGFLVDGADEWNAMRRMLARMHDVLAGCPSRGHEFSRFLESMWIQHRYRVPDDMNFIAGLEDHFQLAEDGIHGTLEEATRSLLEDLAQFKEDTEPGGRPNAA